MRNKQQKNTKRRRKKTKRRRKSGVEAKKSEKAGECVPEHGGVSKKTAQSAEKKQ
jgi:hypothetical protein